MLESPRFHPLIRTPSLARHLVLTVAIAGSSLLLSLYVENINIVFQVTSSITTGPLSLQFLLSSLIICQLIGGTTSAFVCFVLPAALAIKLRILKS